MSATFDKLRRERGGGAYELYGLVNPDYVVQGGCPTMKLFRQSMEIGHPLQNVFLDPVSTDRNLSGEGAYLNLPPGNGIIVKSFNHPLSLS